MARPAGPEIDNLQRLLKRLQLDEQASVDASAKTQTPVGASPISLTAAARVPPLRAAVNFDTVQNTLDGLADVRSKRAETAMQPHKAMVPVVVAPAASDVAAPRPLFSMAAATVVSTVVSVLFILGVLQGGLTRTGKPTGPVTSQPADAPAPVAQPLPAPGPMLQSPVRLPALDQTAASTAGGVLPAGPASQGPASLGPASQGPASQGPASQRPEVDGVAAPGAPATTVPTEQGSATKAAVAPGPASLQPSQPVLSLPAVWVAEPGQRWRLPISIIGSGGVRTQLLINGLEPGAVIGQGLEILPGTWLIDDIDVERSWLERGENPRPSISIDVQLRSASGKLLMSERLQLTTAAAEIAR